MRLQIKSGQDRRLSPSSRLLIWGQKKEVKDKANVRGHTYCPSRFSKLLVKYHCMPLRCSSCGSNVWTVLAFAAGISCSLQRNDYLLVLLPSATVVISCFSYPHVSPPFIQSPVFIFALTELCSPLLTNSYSPPAHFHLFEFLSSMFTCLKTFKSLIKKS